MGIVGVTSTCGIIYSAWGEERRSEGRRYNSGNGWYFLRWRMHLVSFLGEADNFLRRAEWHCSCLLLHTDRAALLKLGCRSRRGHLNTWMGHPTVSTTHNCSAAVRGQMHRPQLSEHRPGWQRRQRSHPCQGRHTYSRPRVSVAEKFCSRGGGSSEVSWDTVLGV